MSHLRGKHKTQAGEGSVQQIRQHYEVECLGKGAQGAGDVGEEVLEEGHTGVEAVGSVEVQAHSCHRRHLRHEETQ